MLNILRFDDNHGGLAYPFLPNELEWQIISRPFGDEADLRQIFQSPFGYFIVKYFLSSVAC
jgi:hypothetical protein